ncbi:MAG: radical SAM family heme chaperone HemW [Candidatus Kapaibacterium sp.]
MAGIYIHYPFCVRKCFYCDFYSETELGLSDKFIESLLEEIAIRQNTKPYSKEIETIFIGGGTPSLIKPANLEKLIKLLDSVFDIEDNAEFTIECNPGTTDINNFTEYRSFGVNRLSIGVQSFNDNELKFLQRIHSSGKAEEAINAARNAGFDNLSVDLIFSIPGQTAESWNNTLNTTLSHAPEHISAYSLIYEEGTPLFEQEKAGKIKKIPENKDLMMYRLLQDSLAAKGYEQYEISNFALGGKKCRHNLNYWYSGDYLAFGPAAHGFEDGQRYWNVSNIHEYLKMSANGELPLEGSEKPDKTQRMEEIIFLGLRAEGFKSAYLEEQTGYSLKHSFNLLKKLENEGLLEMRKGFIKLTKKGYLLADEISYKMIEKLTEQVN